MGGEDGRGGWAGELDGVFDGGGEASDIGAFDGVYDAAVAEYEEGWHAGFMVLVGA